MQTQSPAPAAYAVIGNPIAHSKSPAIHTGFARQAGHDISYVALEAPVEGFAARVDAFRRAGGRGLNITTPFKLDAFAYATRPSQQAVLAGAVNAIKFEDGEVLAENFDGIGIVNDIQRNLGVALAGRRVLLLGAGGAARGALQPFLAAGPSSLVIVNRTVSKAQALAAQFAPYGPVEAIGPEALDVAGPFDVVVNATSAGLTDGTPLVHPAAFHTGSLAYDMVYGRGLTRFLRLARDAGAAQLADGVGMLVEQAAEAFLWWRGVRPDTGPVIAELTVPLR